MVVCSLEDMPTRSSSTTLANIAVIIRHSKWCPACVESDQASLNAPEVTYQKFRISCAEGSQPTILTSAPEYHGQYCLAQSTLKKMVIDTQAKGI